jgi:hypothetical protein
MGVIRRMFCSFHRMARRFRTKSRAVSGKTWQTAYDIISAEVLRLMKAGKGYLCDWCGKEICLNPIRRCKFRKRLHQFCSKPCYLSFHSRNTKSVRCHRCRKLITSKFDSSKMRRNKGKRFCSKYCVDKWRRETSIRTRQRLLRVKQELIKICPRCNSTYKTLNKKQIYCSVKCRNRRIIMNIKTDRSKPNCNCIICNAPLHRPKCRLNVKEPTCSRKCYIIWHSMRLAGPNHPAYRGDDGRGYKDFTAKIKRRVRERDGSRCVLCGDADRLRTHHIDYNKKNPAANNLITTCRDCHNYTNFYRWFWKKLFSELMVKIVEARLALLQGQTNMESQRTAHHNRDSPVPTLGTTARSLYHILAKLHPKSELRPTDENCPVHIQIPSAMEFVYRTVETPLIAPSCHNLHILE